MCTELQTVDTIMTKMAAGLNISNHNNIIINIDKNIRLPFQDI